MTLRNTNGKYFTRNIYLAAYLEVEGYEIEVVREYDGKIAYWVVIDERLDDLVNNKFYQNLAVVDPMALGHAVKSIKNKIYA